MLTLVASQDGARLRGRWFRLRYSQSFADQPARPLVRFLRAGESEQHLLCAAVLGRSAWTWRAPRDLDRLEILVAEEAAGAFRVDAIEPVATGVLLLGVLRKRPRSILPFVLPDTDRGRNVAAHEAFDLAAPDEFGRVLRERRRPLEPVGLDAQLVAEAFSGPRLGFVSAIERPEELAPLHRTLAAFARQHDGGFRLLIRAPADLAGAVDGHGLGEKLEIAADAGLPDADYVARLLPGDEPFEEAVLCLRAFLARRTALDVLYGDSAERNANGSLVAQLKPDWSPTFQQGLDYVGRPCLVRTSLIEDGAAWRDLPNRIAGQHRPQAIGHLKRVLFTLAAPPAPLGAETRGRPSPQPASAAPHASLIVPTRDRVELLRDLCESLGRTGGSYDLVIVDNGSEDPAARTYLDTLAARPDIQVLRRPGPFNFSTLVNAGAEAARGPVLVLLNNDCEIIAGDWLQRLATHAAQPGIGAVGAKLLYANATLQHAGVGLGLGGEAGHRDRKMPRNHPGHLGRLTVPHEVAAVTAASLAVRREVFQEAGGFDESLPVAFNDIDFCLRLLRRGYRNILEPDAVVRHAESASRGRDDGPRRARFLREAALFRARWHDLILDDPYLHPMLTTFRFYDRLG